MNFSTDSRDRAIRRSRVFKTVVAAIATASLTLLSVAPAQADPSDKSEALGKVIDADLLTGDLADAASSDSGNPSDPGPNANPLDVGLLGSVNLSLGTLNIPLISDPDESGLLYLGDAGALSSYASSPNGGTSTASAGVLGDNGAISLDPGGVGEYGSAQVNLTQLLGQLGVDGLTDEIIDHLTLQLGAVGSTATATGDDVESEYVVADGKLVVSSPLVEGLSGTLTTALQGTGTTLNTALGTSGVLGSIVSGVSRDVSIGLASVRLSGGTLGVNGLDDALDNAANIILNEPLEDANSLVAINLRDGTISIDLKQLGGPEGLNGLPPNTQLLTSPNIDLITDAVQEALGTVSAKAGDALESVLDEIALDIRIPARVSVLGLGVVNVFVTVDTTLGQLAGTSTDAPIVDIDGDLLGLIDIGALLGGLVAPLESVLFAPLRAATGTLVTTATTQLESTLDAAVDPILDTLDPVLSGVLSEVVQVTINEQPTPGYLGAESFTVNAVALELLPASEAVRIGLASSTVRADVQVPEISLAPDSVRDGDTTTVTGTEFPPNTEVEVQLLDVNGDPIGDPVTVTTDGEGSFTTQLEVPEGTPAGTEYSVEATATSGESATDGLAVTNADPTDDNTADNTDENTEVNTEVNTDTNTAENTDTNTAENTADNTAENDADNTAENTADNDADNTADNTDTNTAENTADNDADNTADNTDTNTAENTADNEADNTEVNTAENTADNEADNTEVNTAENTADNEADNTAENTADNDADNTEVNTAENTADNEADNTADNTADNEADNTDTNTAENTADNTDTNTAENTADNEADNTDTNTAENTADNEADNTAENTDTNTAENTADNTAENDADNTAENTADNEADNTEVNTAENTADNEADNTEVNTAENTADNEADNTAENTADNEADNTADNTADNEADNTDTNTAENTADNEADNTEVNTAENTADNEADNTEVNTAENTADNEADNTADNTDTNTSENTADNEADNTEVNTAENTADNEADNTADNTDTNTSENTADNEADNTEVNTAENTADNEADNTEVNTAENTAENTADNTAVASIDLTPNRAVKGVDNVLVYGTGYTPDGKADAFLREVDGEVLTPEVALRALATHIGVMAIAPADPGEWIGSVTVDSDGELSFRIKSEDLELGDYMVTVRDLTAPRLSDTELFTLISESDNTADNTSANTTDNTAENTDANTSENTDVNTEANTEVNTDANSADNTGDNTDLNTDANTAVNTAANTSDNTSGGSSEGSSGSSGSSGSTSGPLLGLLAVGLGIAGIVGLINFIAQNFPEQQGASIGGFQLPPFEFPNFHIPDINAASSNFFGVFDNNNGNGQCTCRDNANTYSSPTGVVSGSLIEPIATVEATPERQSSLFGAAAAGLAILLALVGGALLVNRQRVSE
ncbi:choice-of-anchor G family protein [Dietzia timorensis]|uniref:choice-of-anchor G family protein n=2 Tax=Dietzia timorensis TaxID=499555 RepID=UPI0012ECB26B|nr:choice-of-anchor G family protein [Dietzia timorensis]